MNGSNHGAVEITLDSKLRNLIAQQVWVKMLVELHSDQFFCYIFHAKHQDIQQQSVVVAVMVLIQNFMFAVDVKDFAVLSSSHKSSKLVDSHILLIWIMKRAAKQMIICSWFNCLTFRQYQFLLIFSFANFMNVFIAALSISVVLLKCFLLIMRLKPFQCVAFMFEVLQCIDWRKEY